MYVCTNFRRLKIKREIKLIADMTRLVQYASTEEEARAICAKQKALQGVAWRYEHETQQATPEPS